MWLLEHKIIFYSVAALPQPFCGAVFQEFVRDPYPQNVSEGYLGLHGLMKKLVFRRKMKVKILWQ